MSYTLTDQEHAVLVELRDAGPDSEARRAEIILMSADGAQTGVIANTVGLSASQVRYWRRAWREQRLSIFPDLDAVPGEAEVPGAEPETETETETETGPETEPETEPVPGVDVPRRPLVLQPQIGVDVTDSMAEAGRKALIFHFERMLLNEPGSRLGDDIEAVHDMRVATRRMRSAIRLFGPYFEPARIDRFNAELRRVARVLGVVRDLDVLVEKAQRFATKSGANLAPAFQLWEVKLNDARAVLIRHLDSKEFHQFVRRFDKFLNSPGKGNLPLPDPMDGVPFQVRHVAPGLIYGAYERVRAYETAFDDPDITQLHALRIEFKRFRYALEFFADVLGAEVKAVIAACKKMQDHLGDLHDAEVAIDDLSALVGAHKIEFSGVPQFLRPDMSGVVAYVEARRAEKQHLLETFPAAWAAFNSEKNRRSLALAVAAL